MRVATDRLEHLQIIKNHKTALREPPVSTFTRDNVLPFPHLKVRAHALPFSIQS